MHPQFIAMVKDYDKYMQVLREIFIYQYSSSNRVIVAIGETGLDETSNLHIEQQILTFETQVKMAKEFDIPLVLHCRGIQLFRSMLDCILKNLDRNHHIHWHCIRSNSDLRVIDEFLDIFENSYIGLNGSCTHNDSIEQDKIFKKWIRGRNDLLNHLLLETDYPWLCPTELDPKEYNPCSDILTTAKFVELTLRLKGKI
ncbi:unnamed protein product [Didymodactylos carnosus]|uniref:Uncharacterized protein n=1 Tax=Didymodactylos carnosus TaxID=1234261 RepID=A0A816AQM5_9BILA|nr:unnamed protein product [Didymodactylos carnosus]CAF4476838.1 unnamed protein product [Didymodactylos carnosus]